MNEDTFTDTVYGKEHARNNNPGPFTEAIIPNDFVIRPRAKTNKQNNINVSRKRIFKDYKRWCGITYYIDCLIWKIKNPTKYFIARRFKKLAGLK